MRRHLNQRTISADKNKKFIWRRALPETGEKEL